MNMINKDDIIVFKKDFQIDNSQADFEFLSDNYLNSYHKGDEAVVIVRLFSTVEVRLTSGQIITVSIDSDIYDVVYPCLKSMQILYDYFADNGDIDKCNIVSNELLNLILDEALEKYDDCKENGNIEIDLYYFKNNLIQIAQKTIGTPWEEKGKSILQMITV